MRAVLVLAALAATAAPALAASPVNMLTINGSCEGLWLDTNDLTPTCGDQLMQMVYDDGRVGLYAFAGGQIFVFSGGSDSVVGDEIHQDVDQIILGKSETDIMAQPVRGSCVYENPYAGRALFTCEARDDQGWAYKLTFRTDGSPPVDELAE